MACAITIQSIDPSDYIGNSLTTINTNFANLRDGVQTNCTNILSASEVIGTLQTVSNTLQQYSQGRVKAWAVFDGTRDSSGAVNPLPTPRYLYTTPYNITEVYKTDTGIYEVYFAEAIVYPEPAPGESYPYGALVTADSTQVGSNYVWAQPVLYSSDYVTIAVNDGQGSPNYADPGRVTVAIF